MVMLFEAGRRLKVPDALALLHISYCVEWSLEQFSAVLLQGLRRGLNILNEKSDMRCAVIYVAGHRTVLRVSIESHQLDVDIVGFQSTAKEHKSNKSPV